MHSLKIITYLFVNNFTFTKTFRDQFCINNHLVLTSTDADVKVSFKRVNIDSILDAYPSNFKSFFGLFSGIFNFSSVSRWHNRHNSQLKSHTPFLTCESPVESRTLNFEIVFSGIQVEQCFKHRSGNTVQRYWKIYLLYEIREET